MSDEYDLGWGVLEGVITQKRGMYTCPACNEVIPAFCKYKADPPSSVERKEWEAMTTNLKLVGVVVPEHNCVPKTTRDGRPQ